MTDHFQPDVWRNRSWWAAVGLVAATYVYFLLFAEFALLALAEQAGHSGSALRSLLAALGGGGIAGALGAARWHRTESLPDLLAVALAACGAAALLALGAERFVPLAAVCAAVGLSLGALTVWLAATLRRAMGGRRLGLGIGLGTGAAYAVCNLPSVFSAPATTQTLLAVAATGIGMMATRGLKLERIALPAAERGVAARWIGALLALVWLDSAAFYIIQHTESLRGATWAGSATLAANAAVHLLAAMVSGAVIDAGGRRTPVFAAVLLLGAAALVLGGTVPAVVPAHWLYTAGVSLYSVALVHFPASTGRAGVAAAVFGIAGWFGSALGIGMAQDLHAVPGWFVALAVVGVFAALGAVRRGAAVALALGGAALLSSPRAEAADDLVSRGREVFIAEGCLHCHSQFVRPRVATDVERWGPARDLADILAESPPLPGNRRQGPDLANVGNRRSAEWNRLHLREPRAVSPGSRMPSYAHLFRGGDESDGEALVLYLASLGADTIPARLHQVETWRPAAGASATEAEARRLFARLCAPCHGAEGHGDGALAARLSLRPPDWPREGTRRAAGATEAEIELALARIIKFGLPGSPMAGHEYLPDGDVVGLARLVRLWQKR